MKVEISMVAYSAKEIKEKLQEIAEIKKECNLPAGDCTIKVKYEREMIKAAYQEF